MTESKIALKKEYEYFISHFDEFRKNHKGEFVVIKDTSVLGYYDTYKEAIEKTTNKDPIGTFLVQKVSNNVEELSQVYNTHVN